MRRFDPIERLPDGTLFRLTLGQVRSVRKLVKRCCNYADGDCLPLVPPCRAAGAAEAGAGHPHPEEAAPLSGLRQGLPRPLWSCEILPRMRGQSPPAAESKIRPQTALRRRQLGAEKPVFPRLPASQNAPGNTISPVPPENTFYLSTYAPENTHRVKQQILWKGGQRWKYF